VTYGVLIEHVEEERVIGENGLDAFYGLRNVRLCEREDLDVHGYCC
jgi:hypothetical protein